MLEEDLIQLREEAIEALTYTTQQTNGKIVELEARLETLELQATRSTHQTDAGTKASPSVGSSNPDQKV
jgi:hypothetical protein